MFRVYVGEKDNEQGHLVGTYDFIRDAKIMAGKARRVYNGDGWSVIEDTVSGDSIVVEERTGASAPSTLYRKWRKRKIECDKKTS